jgi:hypothetical protein
MMHHEKALQAGKSPTAKAVNFSGWWRNQMKSTMDLAVSGNDVTGTYTSAASSSGGPTVGSIKGYVSGDLISFVVLWEKGSMTAWVGQLVDEDTAPRIKTLWHLVTNIPDDDEGEYLWLSVFAGADEFTR